MGQDLWVSFMQLLPYMLQTGILILFAVLFCWVSAGFWTALMGFLQLLIGRDKYSISASTVGDEPLNPEHRTALIMPICNEDVDRVFAGLRATWESVKATGNAEHFDVYILSDSYNPDICVAEQKAWMELIAEVQGEGQIFYRRRRRRVKRKSGNIDDFCRRWGNQYSYMVVLDADSVMSGDCLSGFGAPDGSESECRDYPVFTEGFRYGYAVCALPTVCDPCLWAAVYCRASLLAVRRITLLGPQRNYPREAVYRALCARAVTGRRFVCGIDSLP